MSKPNLQGFADEIFQAAWDAYTLDGGDIQEIGVRFGLLKEVTRTERCADDCEEHGQQEGHENRCCDLHARRNNDERSGHDQDMGYARPGDDITP